MIKHYLGSDHAGIDIKNRIKDYFIANNLEYVDISPDGQADYPDVASILCKQMLLDEDSLGILVCGSGVGVSMAANRFPHIRAASCTDAYTASMARRHNDANVLCIGQRIVGEGVAISILEAFINSSFDGGRHIARVNKLSKLN